MLKAKMGKQEKTFQQEYLSLTDDYKRITEQFKELQKKFRHFQIADSKKYREVWKMNEEMTRDLMRKVLQADRIIHEQQLGMKWNSPAEDLFRNVDPNFFNGKETAAAADNPDAVVGTVSVQGTGMASGVADAERLKESLAAKFKDHRGYSKTMKRMLELLCNEAGFLVEDKLQKLLAPLHRDEQSLMKLDSIFKALGVETVEDIEKLTSFFVARDHDQDSILASGENSGLGEDQTNLIHPNDVVRAIRRFVEHHRKESSVPAGKNSEGRFEEKGEEYMLDDPGKYHDREWINGPEFQPSNRWRRE
jgi:dynein regulatory complex protein 1